MGDSFRSTASKPLEWTTPPAPAHLPLPAYGGYGNATLDNFNIHLPDPRFDVAGGSLGRPHTAPLPQQYGQYNQPAAPYPGYPPGAPPPPPGTMLQTQPPAYAGMPMMAAMQTAPGQPPVMGYIIPYEQGIFQQLQGDRGSEAGSEGSRRSGGRGSRRARELAAAAAAAAAAESEEYSSGYDDDEADYPVAPAPPRPRRPATAPPAGYGAGRGYPQQSRGYPYQQPDYGSQYGYPPEEMPYDQRSSGGGYPPGQQWSQGYPRGSGGGGGPPRRDMAPDPYSHADLMIDEALVANLDASSPQRGGRSSGGGGQGGSRWRSSMELPAGQLSVLADGSPYRRSTPYGLLGELQRFMGSRRDAFLNHFMMAAAEAGGRGKPTAYIGAEPQLSKVKSEGWRGQEEVLGVSFYPHEYGT